MGPVAFLVSGSFFCWCPTMSVTSTDSYGIESKGVDRVSLGSGSSRRLDFGSFHGLNGSFVDLDTYSRIHGLLFGRSVEQRKGVNVSEGFSACESSGTR